MVPGPALKASFGAFSNKPRDLLSPSAVNKNDKRCQGEPDHEQSIIAATTAVIIKSPKKKNSPNKEEEKKTHNLKKKHNSKKQLRLQKKG